MKLSTGKVAFPIEFDNGEKGVIYFRPKDRGIQERISNFETSVNERVKQIDIEKYKCQFGDDININIDNPEEFLSLSAEEITSLKNRMEALSNIENEYNDAFKKELDIVFDSNVSDVLFKYCQPLDTVIVEGDNGEEKRELYIMHVIHWLMVELKKYGKENQSAMNRHLSKYIK